MEKFKKTRTQIIRDTEDYKKILDNNKVGS